MTWHGAEVGPSLPVLAENVLILQSSIFAAQPCLPKALDNPHPKALEAIHEEEAVLADQSVFLRACFAGNHEQLDLAAARLGKAISRFFDNERP
jgi:hypothetical protein